MLFGYGIIGIVTCEQLNENRYNLFDRLYLLIKMMKKKIIIVHNLPPLNEIVLDAHTIHNMMVWIPFGYVRV